MIVKFLGLVDLLSAVIILSYGLELNVSIYFTISLIGLLFLKSFFFMIKGDIGSILDILVVALFILSFFIALPISVFYIMFGFLGIKALLSLV